MNAGCQLPHGLKTHGRRNRPTGAVKSALCAGILAILALQGATPAANAQTPGIEPGEAVVTRFSGVAQVSGAAGETVTVIDPDGPVAEIVDLNNPGRPSAGQAWRDAPQRALVSAADVGQVFGIAFDDQVPPNIYLTATWAFGLHRNGEGTDWMSGQWGADGGPGTVYKLDAADGYRASVFAEILLNGRRNSGPALGNITFDRTNRQFFVSDLETGMIHRIGIGGQDLGFYDHGMTGRPQFLDAVTGETAERPQVAFDPASAAAIDSCTDGAFSQTPACWNAADFRRRVWGIAAHRDAETGAVRLYYAIWSSQGFENPDWAVDPQEQQNTLWSIGIDSAGGFQTDDIRREFTVPGFFTDPQDYDRAGGSHPISDIAISDDGEMALAERGGPINLGLAEQAPFTWPGESRVLRYRRNDSGVWEPVGRHDVGIDDREEEGQPYLRANAAGGVDFGFGYDVGGNADPDQNDAFIWFSGDELCGSEGPCPGAGPADSERLSGIQGQPEDLVAEIAPAAAYDAYPSPGPATPPAGPDQSYMVEIQPPAGSSFVGDVEIFKGGAPAQEGEPDLAVIKSMPPFCMAGGICTARVTVTNNGPGTWSGPLFLRDTTLPSGLGFAAVGSPWVCAPVGSTTACYHPPVELAAGHSRTLVMDIAVSAGFGRPSLTNCAEINWPLSGSGDPKSVVRAVQTALLILGYNPGTIDGVLGRNTSTAIAELQRDLGMPATGTIDAALMETLFPGNAVMSDDHNPGNDRSCDTTAIEGGPPPGGIHLPVGSRPGHAAPASIHLPFGSSPAHVFPHSIHVPIGSGPAHVFPHSVHFPIGSGPGHIFPNSVHLPIGSGPGHIFPNSIHLPIGSGGHVFPNSIHLPIGSIGGHLFPQSIHLPIGSIGGHLFPQSIHLPIGSNPGHLFPQSLHLPIGSNPWHLFPQSIHLPVGSGPGHIFPNSIHFPFGSNPGHVFPQSIHFPPGSNLGHQFPQSIHLPVGSNGWHQFPASVHLPIGSNGGHQFPASIHMPIGSGGIHLFPASIHLPIGSGGGHQFPNSIHFPAGSNLGHQLPLSIHQPIGSGAGHQPPGSLHFPIGSAGHLPAGSFHFPIGSGGHQPAGSIHLQVLSKPQLHEVSKSNAHLPVGSLHLPVGSGGHVPVGSVHFPVGSGGGITIPADPSPAPPGGHLPIGSQVTPHLPAGSRPQIHLPIGSRPQIHLPIGSRPQVHLPVGSRPQVHLPVGSRPQIHLPVGSRPQVHLPVGSRPQVHLPVGSRPQVHLPVGSRPQVHVPVGSRPQVHLPVGSRPQVHLPVGSRPQVHLPVGSQNAHMPPGSVQIHRPVGSRPQVHLPIGSRPQIHLPVGSRPQVHLPVGSQNAHTPPGSVHRPPGSVSIRPQNPPTLQINPDVLKQLVPKVAPADPKPAQQPSTTNPVPPHDPKTSKPLQQLQINPQLLQRQQRVQ